MTIERIIENFEFLDDWEERYRYVIDLGRKLEGLDAADKTEDNRVQGCVSNVWMTWEANHSTTPLTLRFKADSDAHIVRGLVAILLLAYSEKSAQEILAIDIKDLFEQLDLQSHLSPSRSNGFFAMVERIKAVAFEVEAATAS